MNIEVLLPYICLMGGVYLIVSGIAVRKELEDSKSWPKTSGVILESTIQSEWARAGSSRIYVVKPKVTYAYQVEGRKYNSTRLALAEYDTANEMWRAERQKNISGDNKSKFITILENRILPLWRLAI